MSGWRLKTKNRITNKELGKQRFIFNFFSRSFLLLKFLFIFTGAIWGIYGFLLTFAALLFHLSQLESFGVPYMLPSVCGENLNYDEKKDDYVRYPFAYMLKRPVFTREGRRIRKKEGR